MTTLKFIPILLLTLTSCTTQNDKGKTETRTTFVDSSSGLMQTQIITTNRDTLTIDKKSAIFYSPDTLQIEKRKNAIGEENFYVGADDYLNYMQFAHDFLDSSKVTIIDAKDKKYLKFVRGYKSQAVIKLDTLPELWGIYFFEPNKDFKLVDMTIIDEEYKSYFK